MFSPLLYSLFTHDCMATQASNSITKLADDTTVVGITDNLKWSTHTDSVVKKAQQLLFNLRRLNKYDLAHKTITNLSDAQLRASCQTVPLPGMATAPPSTAELSRGWCSLPNASPRAHCLPSRIPTPPDVTGRPKISSRTSNTRATACSPRYHTEGEVSTDASNL
jgi:hypothetical protein